MNLAALSSFPLKRLSAGLLDLVLPPRCLACGEEVDAAHALCAACWQEITFLGGPNCACCGLPFAFDLGAGALCGACIEAHPGYDRARSALRYDEGSRRLILAFKHGDRLHGVPAFGTWMRRAGAELLAEADILMPIPLHWTRLFKRRYNQAALLAYAIERACRRADPHRVKTGLRVAPDWLIRRRRTLSQGEFGATGRRRNVQNAFALKPGRNVKGLRIVLIDDVLTTGATVEECALILRRAGAARIDVLTLARSLRHDAANLAATGT